jgi:hypothetical protein
MNGIHRTADTTLKLQSVAMPEKVFGESVFSSSRLQPVKFQIREVRPYQPDWILGILMFCVILVTWARVFYYKRMQQIFLAPFSQRFLNQISRDGNLFSERISLALGIVFVLVASLLIFEVNQQILGLTFQPISQSFLFGAIVMAVIIFQTVKAAMIQLLGVIFKTRETTYFYLLNMLIFDMFSGLALLAGLILMLYLKSITILYIILIIITVLLVFRFVRGFFIGISLRKFSYLFLFVYLCSLEILPLLIIIKLLFNHANYAGG